MTSVMNRRDKARVAASLLIAAALHVFGPLAQGIHLLSVPHHFCAEHHALEHDACDGDDCYPHYAASSRVDEILAGAELRSNEHQHRICHQATDSRRELAGAELASGPGQASGCPDAEPVVRQESRHGLLALTVAPKQSPPHLS